MNTNIDTMDMPETGSGWMPTTAAGGAAWAKLVQSCGGRAMGGGTSVSVTMQFTTGSMDAYSRACSTVHSLLCRCPATASGSTWGDDGVGGMIAMERGSVTIHKSGISKRFAAGIR
jgi:hypothetical protein